MTSDTQRVANRQNAKKSSGPRTEQGKAISSQNARRHGATAAPSPDRIADWFRVIVGDPEAGPLELVGPDPHAHLALALATAEARLCEAQAALDRHLAASLQVRATQECWNLKAGDGAVVDLLDVGASWTPARRRKLDKLMRELMGGEAPPWPDPDKQERLLRSYARDAKGRRDRAFANWIAFLAQRRDGRTSGSLT